MFEQFGKYQDVKWHACATAQFIGMNDKIQTSPDLECFRLERFKDLRAQHGTDENKIYEIMLIDNRSKTNIFIDGPDGLIDRILERLPCYKDKSWEEIQAMNLENNVQSCENAYLNLCDPRVRELIEWKEALPGEKASCQDLEKANKICATCKNYKFKA